MSSGLLMIVSAVCGFLAVAGIGFALTSRPANFTRRVKVIAAGERRARQTDANAVRRRQMQDSMKGLRDRDEAKRKGRVAGKSITDRIRQAGYSFPETAFWIGSAVAGVVAGATVFILTRQPIAAAGAVVAFGLGAPRWVLGYAITARQKKFMMQFADSLDVIVRGVKSGLPLNECLKIIATESPEPIRGEFERVVDSLSMGMSVDQALEKLYQRMPLQEVNFFSIVMAIQQRAGGNLSEALGNLSGVLRSRKLLREKIKALSAEAKASAMIIGSLPVIVMGLVYMTTPDYIMELFRDQMGHFILLIAAGLMGAGIYIMRSMINFDY